MRSSARVPGSALAAALFCVPPVLVAQAPAPGAVTGRVVDTAGVALPNAVVFVRGTRLGTTSDATGRFRIAAVPAGDYVLVARRVGYASDSATVVVAAGATSARDLRLRASASTLAAVVVRASPRLSETREAALVRRDTAANIVSTLSGDDIRALPNANAAEAAARMPGVSTERDEGEGKFVQVRGTEPRLSNVTIDGAHVPGTEAGNRIPKLDAVPSDLLGAIEISKTLTADMDADAIGGSVNLVTKTPEGRPRGYVALQGGQQTQLSAKQGQTSFTYGGRFGDAERLGVLVGASYDRNNRSIQDLEGGWGVNDGGRSFPVEWDQRDYVYGRTRAGGGGAVDYRFAGGSSVYLRGLYSDFRNFGTRYRYDLATDGNPPTSGTTTDGIGTGTTLTREVSNRTPIERLFGFTAGGRIPAGRLEIDYAGNFSGTRQSVTNYRFNDFTYAGADGSGVPLVYDASNINTPRYRFTNAADSVASLDPANYALSGYSINSGLATGRDDGGQVNALLHYGFGGADAHPSTFKFGVKLRDEHKDYVNTGQRFSYNAPAAGGLTLAQVQSSFTDPDYYGAVAPGFTLGPVPAVGAVARYEDANAGLFTNTTNAARNAVGSFNGGETIYSGYGMNTTDFGPLRVNLGLRLEATHSSYDGNVATRPKGGAYVITNTPGSQNYVDLFPSAQLRYALDAQSNLRLAVTRAIARPNYYDLAPHLQGDVCTSCATNYNNLSAGNPDLKPQHAWNYDLLGERYLPGAGVLSGGIFYKRITDFIYLQNFIYGGPVTDFQGYYGRRPANGGAGHLAGAEVQYTQRLAFLPGALAGVGVDVNWTHVESKVALLNSDGSVARRAQLARQSPNVANLALTYDLGPVSARGSWQYQGASIYSYGDGTRTAGGDTYFYPHGQVDASIIANVTPLVAVQLQGLNLNNEIFGFYQGAPGATYSVQRETYGRSFILGVKYGFGR
ncbi:TonB-dependent receptor [Gemmatimonadetes bacterium T265]|nr:TonB-dependent receptor [Gemmatimonadetes bacterium T265]